MQIDKVLEEIAGEDLADMQAAPSTAVSGEDVEEPAVADDQDDELAARLAALRT